MRWRSPGALSRSPGALWRSLAQQATVEFQITDAYQKINMFWNNHISMSRETLNRLGMRPGPEIHLLRVAIQSHSGN